MSDLPTWVQVVVALVPALALGGGALRWWLDRKKQQGDATAERAGSAAARRDAEERELHQAVGEVRAWAEQTLADAPPPEPAAARVRAAGGSEVDDLLTRLHRLRALPLTEENADDVGRRIADARRDLRGALLRLETQGVSGDA